MRNNETNNKQARRRGESLADGQLHTADHSRRSFLKGLGVAGASGFLLNRLPVNSFSPSSLTQALVEGDDERILVLIRLKGGNDGLNTFIPVHDYGTYQTARPRLAIPQSETVNFAPTLQGHPSLRPLQSLWNEGQMRVIQNVGYPTQNLSHFRSSDIWATTSDSDEVISSGVLGRYLQGQLPDFLTSPPETPPAIQIGGSGNLIFNNEDNFNYAISTENPTALYNIVSTGQLHDVLDLPDCSYGEQLGYVRTVANTTFRYAGILADTFEMGRNTANYVNDRLGDQLALVARMLRGGLKTKLFVVEIDGFDTHAEQADAHATLLDSIARNTTAFFKDMRDGEMEDRVLAMTFSEFGRRIQENGSLGTDHGAAAPLMLFGKGLNGNGVSGGLPNLTQTDQDGNMIYEVDFRNIYATVFRDWLCIPSDVVTDMMGADYGNVDTLGLECQGIVSTRADADSPERLKLAAYRSGGDIVVEYEMAGEAATQISLSDMAGRRVATLYQGRSPGGTNTRRLPVGAANWAAGIYIVSLETGGRVYSRKIGFFPR
ncbi:DUF1501 domain-containing protein [Lewinella sp. 4G2]|uniref:DUF1501 domain-containing protein n=1 Tax=Lewinella sp. 4G2 TaxID=1803372 RepID=UPI0007B4B307|nr:DUF1501 domain-containing protein [Lewinella sp. 4G2]OAV43439.1 hypothetical protein A3850_002530 [Lewinella sp. 4G2]